MVYDNIPYRSFCWVLGTTSFRTAQLNLKTEQQLRLLTAFRTKKLEAGVRWVWNPETQSEFYDFMKEEGFLSGQAPNKDKDARQKTSGLTTLGLARDNREITEAGSVLLEIFQSGDFSSDNILALPKDSYFYLKQLLKTHIEIEGTPVRPFLALAYLLNKFGYLSWDEFTYLLPLVSSNETLGAVSKGIEELRSGVLHSADDVLFKTLMVRENYQEASRLIQREQISEDLITTVGMNRKSRKYDAPYYRLFLSLQSVFLEDSSTSEDLKALLAATKSIKGNAGIMWRKLIFKKATTDLSITRNGRNCIQQGCPFLEVDDLPKLKAVFFKYLQLFKAKATLEDYSDLNRRYFKLTDTVLFKDHLVKFDTIPAAYFKLVGEELKVEIFKEHPSLFEDVPLTSISPLFNLSDREVLSYLSTTTGRNLNSLTDVHDAVRSEREARLHQLLETTFTDVVLAELLDCFAERNDSRITELVTPDATISTIFEYILALVWYRLSGNSGDILEFMKLQLEADLLPRSHAIGGDADIVYEYEESDCYPAHALVLEATLADSGNQRRMEMEPVSRHLGNQIARSGNLNDYCVFVAPHLDVNTVGDFRLRKNSFFTASNGVEVEGMKILPLSTLQLRVLLLASAKYNHLYAAFDNAFKSETMHPKQWIEELAVELELATK